MTQEYRNEAPTLSDALLAEPEPAGEPDPAPARTKGLGRIFRGNRALWVTSLVAVLCLVAGLVVGRFVMSPADAAENTNAPKPGYITVPVEYGELSNDVTLRGQVGYADATEVKLTASELAEAAVVTGHVPAVGDDLEAGSIALEIAGRPVFVLPGQLPSYRTLRIGMSGPDVTQLKKALAAVGINAGKGDTFDRALADGIRKLYSDAGYTPAVSAEAKAGVDAARQAVRDADKAVTDAKIALKQAGQGPSDATRRQWKATVDSARRGVTAAQRGVDAAALDVQTAEQDVSNAETALATARTGGDPDEIAERTRDLTAAQKALVAAKDALASSYESLASAKESVDLALDQQKEALKPPDVSAAKAGVKAAEQQRVDAGKQLSEAKRAALPYLPAAEALFLVELPRRVDQVLIERGSVISGAVMTVSGATVELTGSAAKADTDLLKIGDEAFFELPDGTQHRAVIAKIDAENGASRATITFAPDPLETEMIQQIQGSNVRVQVPVGATDGEVLSVPYAALTAGPGGESRVEVVEGDPKDPKATTRLVVVTTGLKANGYVEVTPTEGELKAGDLVVVGA